MKKENIFIHIPKTGGTTINCAMNNVAWQTKPDFNYRHIDYQTKRSNSADIFNALKNDQYKNHHVFMLLRHPVDRMISEYSFIKTRKEFMSLIKPYPKNFVAYIKSRQTNNYMIGFLIGNSMFDKKTVTQDDLDIVINTINNLNIKVGIFEHYATSLKYFSEFTKLKWRKNIDIKRITLNRPKLDEISQEIEDLIIKHNPLDYKLYNYCLKKFKENININDNKGISFTGNKYNYILKYTERFNLLEIALKNLDFVKLNSHYFQQLNLHLHNVLKITNGKDYVSLWNKAFIDNVNLNMSNTELDLVVKKINLKDEPLENTIKIAKIIERIFKVSIQKNSKIYKNKLIFDASKIIKPKKQFKWF